MEEDRIIKVCLLDWVCSSVGKSACLTDRKSWVPSPTPHTTDIHGSSTSQKPDLENWELKGILGYMVILRSAWTAHEHVQNN